MQIMYCRMSFVSRGAIVSGLAEPKQSGPIGSIWIPIARFGPIGNFNLALCFFPIQGPIWDLPGSLDLGPIWFLLFFVCLRRPLPKSICFVKFWKPD